MTSGKKKFWLGVIGTLLAVATGIFSLESCAAYKVDRYMNEWFAKNISYAGTRTARFSRVSFKGGVVELRYRGTVTLYSGRRYDDDYVFVLIPARGSGSFGDVRMEPVAKK